MLAIKYFFPMIMAGVGGIVVAVNTFERSIPTINSFENIQKDRVENKESPAFKKSKDLSFKVEKK